MRPWQHACSSARNVRPWTSDLDLHEFMDVTKFACADRRHRVVLHHIDLGAEVVSRVFPERTDGSSLVSSHVIEDLGQPATLADWFEYCEAGQLPSPVSRRLADGPKGVAAMVGARHPEWTREAVRKVCEFLFSPTLFLPSQPERALPLFMNAVGPLIVRRVFGPPEPPEDGKTVVDYGWIAEAVIYTVFGRIPDLGDVVRCWTAEPVRALRSQG